MASVSADVNVFCAGNEAARKSNPAPGKQVDFVIIDKMLFRSPYSICAPLILVSRRRVKVDWVHNIRNSAGLDAIGGPVNSEITSVTVHETEHVLCVVEHVVRGLRDGTLRVVP